MKAFHELSAQILARDASFFALAGIVLMVGFSFEPPVALKIGATVALLFSISQVWRASLVSEDGVHRLEAWRSLDPGQRPAGDGGRRCARDSFVELLLRAAKLASVIAIGFYCAALFAAAFA